MQFYSLYVTHIFFFYASVIGHLGCFHFQPVVNREAMNMAEHLWCRISSPLGICQGMVCLEHMVDLFLAFWEFSTLIFIVVASLYHSTHSKWVFPFPHIPSSIFLLLILLAVAILTVMRWNIKAVLICICLISGDNKHFWVIF